MAPTLDYLDIDSDNDQRNRSSRRISILTKTALPLGILIKMVFSSDETGYNTDADNDGICSTYTTTYQA